MTQKKVTDPEELVQRVRAIHDEIPGFTHLDLAKARSLVASTAVSPEFLGIILSAMSASPTLAANAGMEPDEIRWAAAFRSRYAALIDEAAALDRGLRTTAAIWTNLAGTTALQIYHIAQELIRQKEHADLIPYVAEMKRLNKRGKRPKKKES
jgi:hypothetical protein